MKHMVYELMYIIPSRFSDSEIEGVTKEVQKTLEKHGATVEKTDVLGKLKLAYPINKERYGTYVLSYMNVEGSAISAIDTDLKLTDEVIRHVIVKREEGIPSEAFSLVEYESPITAEGKRVHQSPKAPKAPVQKAAPKVESTPISEEEIDKKLDSILDDADLGEV